MRDKQSLMKRFWEQTRDALKKMGDGFEAANKTPEFPTRSYTPLPPKRKNPH